MSAAGRAYLSEPIHLHWTVADILAASRNDAQTVAERTARILADVEPAVSASGNQASGSLVDFIRENERSGQHPALCYTPAFAEMSRALDAALSAPDFAGYLAAQREQEASC